MSAANRRRFHEADERTRAITEPLLSRREQVHPSGECVYRGTEGLPWATFQNFIGASGRTTSRRRIVVAIVLSILEKSLDTRCGALRIDEIAKRSAAADPLR